MIRNIGFFVGITVLISFGTASAVTYPVDGAVNSLVAVDVNGDGHPDIAASNYYFGGISILINNGDGTFQDEVFYPSGNGYGTNDIGNANQRD